MLAIPYLDKEGLPLTIRFRCLAQHDHRELFHGKYNSLKGDTPRVFNVGAIHTADEDIHIAEGELDAIILCSIGLPAIAIPGAHIWRSHMRRMLAGFNRAWMWADPDEAGAELRALILKALPSSGRAVRLDKAIGDVTDHYLACGAETLLDLIETEED